MSTKLLNAHVMLKYLIVSFNHINRLTITQTLTHYINKRNIIIYTYIQIYILIFYDMPHGEK